MKGRKIVGKRVVGARGWKIGTVRDVIFDEDTWKIASLEVQLHRPVADEYQMKRLLARSSIEVGVDSVRAVGDQVILSVTKTELRRIIGSLREQRGSTGRPSSQSA